MYIQLNNMHIVLLVNCVNIIINVQSELRVYGKIMKYHGIVAIKITCT